MEDKRGFVFSSENSKKRIIIFLYAWFCLWEQPSKDIAGIMFNDARRRHSLVVILCNECLRQKTIPVLKMKAEGILIQKEGTASNLEHYRQSSLLFQLTKISPGKIADKHQKVISTNHQIKCISDLHIAFIYMKRLSVHLRFEQSSTPKLEKRQ